MTISEEHKDIIGTLNPDNTPARWPKVNLTGAAYSKLSTIQPISKEYFVVLPPSFTEWDTVKALKERYGGTVASEPVGKKGEK